ncbi:hypothetical protein KEH51_26745, partial [[Brevibacterium] frigoritolerans]|nr:hypothetical protein [Peribacillus frigoritolerans]
ALFYLSKYTYPFIIAMIIAFLMNPGHFFFSKGKGGCHGVGCIRFLLLIFPFICGSYHLYSSPRSFQGPITLPESS